MMMFVLCNFAFQKRTNYRTCPRCFSYRLPSPNAPKLPTTPPGRSKIQCTQEPSVDSQQLVSSLDRKMWNTSVAGSDVTLLYSPFLEEMQNTLLHSFENVQDYPLPQFFARATSQKKPARIESWCYQCSIFRKIRLTYLDAGLAAQVFNAVWYPATNLELPILGVDFLSFGEKNILCVMDFQPLMTNQSYLDKYIKPLHPIRERYADLAGRMSGRFYDENRFFSKELLFGRFNSTKPVYERLLPAFREYLGLYIQLAMQSSSYVGGDEEETSRIWQLQCEYDRYSAEKDPAMGLFRSYFGSLGTTICL